MSRVPFLKEGSNALAKYHRIILKLSGETLAPKDRSGTFDAERVRVTADVVKRLSEKVQLGIVLGGGNIWRGRFTNEMDPVNADQMGMLATIINALCLADALRAQGAVAEVFSAQQMDRFTSLYTAKDADACMRAGGIALLAGGTGQPFFTTDTAAVLRAAELKADAVFKGTNVEGVFDKDPNKHPDAVLIREISCGEAAGRGLKAMDLTAFQLCIDARIPVVRVFSMEDLQNILRVADGEALGTTLRNE